MALEPLPIETMSDHEIQFLLMWIERGVDILWEIQHMIIEYYPIEWTSSLTVSIKTRVVRMTRDQELRLAKRYD